VGSPGAGRLVNGGLPEDSVAAANGWSWPHGDVREPLVPARGQGA
jgi:hypothetical protein